MAWISHGSSLPMTSERPAFIALYSHSCSASFLVHMYIGFKNISNGSYSCLYMDAGEWSCSMAEVGRGC